jgi:hypothetical protein
MPVEVNTRAIVAYASAETSHVGKLGPLKNGDTVRQRPWQRPALFDPPQQCCLHACLLFWWPQPLPMTSGLHRHARLHRSSKHGKNRMIRGQLQHA